MPFMLHSIWMRTAEAAPDVERLRFRDDFDDDMLEALDDDARRLILEVAEELDQVGSAPPADGAGR
jgi:hypothetical protein